MKPVFVTGIGTGIGKTLVSAILAESLHADYWKPVQAGYEQGTDSSWVRSMLTNAETVIHPETYKLQLPASPHIAAPEENLRIRIERIQADFEKFDRTRPLIIEGAGGLLVPLNENEFVLDLIRRLDVQVVLVSRNYLGSINHSLLTASVCRAAGVPVAGWAFNDQYMNYEQDIVRWSGYPSLLSLPALASISKETIVDLSRTVESALKAAFC